MNEYPVDIAREIIDLRKRLGLTRFFRDRPTGWMWYHMPGLIRLRQMLRKRAGADGV